MLEPGSAQIELARRGDAVAPPGRAPSRVAARHRAAVERRVEQILVDARASDEGFDPLVPATAAPPRPRRSRATARRASPVARAVLRRRGATRSETRPRRTRGSVGCRAEAPRASGRRVSAHACRRSRPSAASARTVTPPRVIATVRVIFARRSPLRWIAGGGAGWPHGIWREHGVPRLALRGPSARIRSELLGRSRRLGGRGVAGRALGAGAAARRTRRRGSQPFRLHPRRHARRARPNPARAESVALSRRSTSVITRASIHALGLRTSSRSSRSLVAPSPRRATPPSSSAVGSPPSSSCRCSSTGS